jgi:hypothetical protein
MPGLKDIAPSFSTVTVKGVVIDVTGISAKGIAYLFHRFPIVREMIGGKDVDLSPEALAALAPEAIAAIIAVGTGAVNDPEAEAAAATLGAEAQLELLDAIIRETMPGGVGPFVEKLTGMFNANGAAFTSTAVGISPSESKG